MKLKESVEKVTFDTRPDESEYANMIDLAKEILNILSNNGLRCGATPKTIKSINKALDLMYNVSDMYDMSNDDEYDSQY